MESLVDRDYFSDPGIVQDPAPRARGRVRRHGAMVVTGYDEILDALNRPADVRLITPKRLKQNEAYLIGLTNRLIGVLRAPRTDHSVAPPPSTPR